MRRREFITLLGGAMASLPLTSRAQQTTIPRIGVLLFAGPEHMGPFSQALRDLGYIEGKTIQIETRSAESNADRLPGLVAELIGSKVDIIVASLTPAVVAAKNATRDIPIVMAPAGDPLAMGLIASLARPGGNLTGISAAGSELAAKSLELIPEIVPGARRAGILANSHDPFTKPYLESIQKARPTVPLELQIIVVHDSDELEGAYAAMVREHADALKRTLAAQSKSIEYLYDAKNRAEVVGILVKASGQKVEDVEKSYDFFNKNNLFDRTGKISRLKMNALIDALVGLGDVKTPGNIERFLLSGVAQLSD